MTYGTSQPRPFRRSPARGHSRDTRDLGALNIPFDILRQIFEEFCGGDIKYAVYLALTNSFLRDVGQQHINNTMRAHHAPWYLDRIICVGDYHDGDDMPFAPQLIGFQEEQVLCGDHPVKTGSKLYNLDETYYNYSYMRQRWRDVYPPHGYEFRGLSAIERKMMKSMATPDFSWNGWPWTEWILCSWTAAEYVRASAVADLTGSSCDGPWTKSQLGLGHVLITQISWSSDCSASLAYQGPIHRGRWAGHRIAITTLDELTSHPAFNVKKQWNDVTDRVLKEVVDIWRPEFPEMLAEHLRSVPSSEVCDNPAAFTPKLLACTNAEARNLTVPSVAQVRQSALLP